MSFLCRLLFDVEGLVEKVKKFIKFYEEKGISRERILIKFSLIWEGVEVVKLVIFLFYYCIFY